MNDFGAVYSCDIHQATHAPKCNATTAKIRCNDIRAKLLSCCFRRHSIGLRQPRSIDCQPIGRRCLWWDWRLNVAELNGRFTWYELMTTDMASARAFYAAVVGWGIEDRSQQNLTYTVFTSG